MLIRINQDEGTKRENRALSDRRDLCHTMDFNGHKIAFRWPEGDDFECEIPDEIIEDIRSICQFHSAKNVMSICVKNALIHNKYIDVNMSTIRLIRDFHFKLSEPMTLGSPYPEGIQVSDVITFPSEMKLVDVLSSIRRIHSDRGFTAFRR